MIADTTFLSDLLGEMDRGDGGPTSEFMKAHRREMIRTTVISVAEIAVLFESSQHAWLWLRKWTIYRMHDGIVNGAADIDRHLRNSGKRLGENDNWIAAFSVYYRQPILSRDVAFDRVPNLRRIDYWA